MKVKGVIVKSDYHNVPKSLAVGVVVLTFNKR